MSRTMTIDAIEHEKRQRRPETLAAKVQENHNLRSLHLFAHGYIWRVFGSRGDERFQQSVEEGRGLSIEKALQNLDERLKAGPIDRGPLPPWDELELASNGMGLR